MNMYKDKAAKLLSRLAAVLCVFAAILLGCKTNVTTPIAVTDVTLDKATVTLAEQESVTLKATVVPANAANKTVTWSSDKPAIASVDQDGKVTAKQVGTANITVTTADGDKAASCKVRVLTRYTITYNLNGGTDNGGNPTFYTEETGTITLKDAERTGYTFVGWYDNAACSGFPVTRITTGDAVDKTFWAKWKINEYPITFSVEGTPANGTIKAEVDGSEIHTNDKVEHGKTVTFTATPTISGYVIGTWEVTPKDALIRTGDNAVTVKITAETAVKVRFVPGKTYTVNSVNFTMKDIAAVTNGTVGHSSEYDNGVHTVSLTAYRIGESEVTQELWQAVMGNNPSEFKGAGNPPNGSEVQEKRPVESVNWYECIAFCNELTKKVAELGESQCVYSVEGHIYTKEDAENRKTPQMDMSKKGFRLPTEAEWEWAAKGGTEYRWAGTDEADKLKDYAWYDANSGNKTHEVKKKQANGYGLYDMSGNVWEWCWDWYDILPNSLPADYTGAASGAIRVIRGGSWNFYAEDCVVSLRLSLIPGFYPGSSYDFLGFRVACRP